MRKFISNIGFAAAVMVICTLFAGCNVQDAQELKVSLQNASVSPNKGEQFVKVKCAGDWTLSLVSEEGEDITWARLSIASGSGDKTNLKLSYESNEVEVSRTLSVILTCGNQVADCQMTQRAKGEAPEAELPDAPTNLEKAQWLELPAMDNPNLDYYSHSFKMNGKTYRNYTFGYSKKDYLAVWVAYPLSDLYTNGSDYDVTWEDNPLVDDRYEPNFTKSFAFKDYKYERGHQIANADRKCSKEANQQTYYFTNATLQHKDFNGPVWGKLEGNMRLAANSADTLYVVTGCTLSASPQYVTDPDGRKVPVPSGYFKAAVRYHKASTISQWLGAAFYMEHDASKYPTQQVTTAETMSIDELEAKLGIDFFVNLPSKVGEAKAAAIEAQNPDSYASIWNIK